VSPEPAGAGGGDLSVSAGPLADVAVILPAAGAGLRLGPGTPKALRLLGGEPLLVHAIRRVAAVNAVGFLIVVAPSGREDSTRDLVRATLPDAFLADDHELTGGSAPWAAGHDRDHRVSVTVVTGGAERQESVAAGLERVPEAFEIVLVHDAARALAPTTLVESVAAAVRAGQDAVIPVLPVTDTITRVDPSGVSLGHLPRDTLGAVQTPQGFRRSLLARAHAAGAGAAATDDAGLVARLGVPVHTVPGSPDAFKITTTLDFRLAQALLADQWGG
jgi:2-C-methyl-D-erythritol 4-phosphate cytidylyltransferase